jgi:hypothetical protein
MPTQNLKKNPIIKYFTGIIKQITLINHMMKINKKIDFKKTRKEVLKIVLVVLV